MAYVTVLRTDELAPGTIVPVEVAGRPLIIYRVGERYFAAQRRCIHQGADLAVGRLVRTGAGSDSGENDSGGEKICDFLVCPLHGWRFHVETGAHERSPETCLRTYAVEVTGDEIRVDPTPRYRMTLPGQGEET